MVKNKVLIIRFSSFGDIVQCSSVVELIRQKFKASAQIHWATRSEFESLVVLNQQVDKVLPLNKKLGALGLIKYALSLRKENYTHVYDAHNNLRSKIIKIFLVSRISRPEFLTRSKDRLKRILLFGFRINKFPKPFIGIDSYISPLLKWEIVKSSNPQLVQWEFSEEVNKKIESIKLENFGSSKFIALVPSAAWEMKRWPIEHWKKLIEILPDFHFAVLGGKEDLFCQELVDVNPTRVWNLAGKLSLIESCKLVSIANLVISADTGLLHVADVIGTKGLSLMGPTAFGFTKSTLIKTLQLDLPCRPCSKDGRGKCSQDIYQKCMVNITPSMVANEVQHQIFD